MKTFNKNASLLLCLCSNILAIVDAVPTVLFPQDTEKDTEDKQSKIQIFSKHYDMFNGGKRGNKSFWDEKYQNESVTLATRSYQWLSGGSGDLTDGYKELESGWKEKNDPYVGWNKKGNQIPDIDFFFHRTVAVDEIRIAVDHSSNAGKVCAPSSAIIGGVEYSFPGPADNNNVFKSKSRPYEAVIRMDVPIIDDQIRVTLIAKCDWVLVSEVEFYAVDSDRDGVLDGIDECAFTTEPDVSCNDIGAGRYCWNGKNFVTRNDKSGEIVSVGSYTIELTGGCSCDQILDETDHCSEADCKEKGCTSDILNEWIASKVIYPISGTTKNPTNVPSFLPSRNPSSAPSKRLTNTPTLLPSQNESSFPSNNISEKPTLITHAPTVYLSSIPSDIASDEYTLSTTSESTDNPVSSKPCLIFCEQSDYPWTDKCGWIGVCAGCPPCL